MEFSERRTFTGRQPSQEIVKVNWGSEDSHRILVVVDAGKEFATTAMDWTLDNVVQRGDALRLLAILQQPCNPSKGGFQAGLSKLGYKSWTDEKSWNGVNRSVLDSEIASKKQQLQSNLDLHLRCQKLGVTLDIDVQISRDIKLLVVEEAKNFGAHHVVLDRSMKKDKKHFIDNLTCYVTRVKTIDLCEPLRPGLPPDMMLDLPPPSPKHELQPSAAVSHGPHRSSSAPAFVTCLVDSDLRSVQDEAEVIDAESPEHEFNNLEIMDNSAVRQWLHDQGSPELGIHSREESLQLSSSPISDVVSSSTEDSFAEHMSTLAKVSTSSGGGNFHSGEEIATIMNNPCSLAPMTDGPPPVLSSLSQSTESLVSMVRPLASMIPAASNCMTSVTPPGLPGPAGVGRVDAWSTSDLFSTGNGARQQGPISVQPRRVDASWTLHNLNDLLNGDVGKRHSPVEKVRVKRLEVVEQVVKVSGPPKTLKQALSPRDMNPLSIQRPVERSSSIRRAVFMKKQGPLTPPLCTICKHKTPEFGKAVRRFSYAELRIATDNFNHHNYLAQGGYGSVYRGILPEGQLIAVKQHKIASSQGDQEFCAEVEVLSCAQHRNLVTLIGYCVEDHKRLLVYEYVCNGSLDRHLSAKNKEGLQWRYRQKIALGAARALRYLHEECRVGCIVHRDMRPNNILLTHDFTPMVGDFGLARRQLNGEMAEETRVLGTLGYLAPEYAETGHITEKADVYAFGVVLLEIITGRKAIDHQRARGGILLTDWARPLLDNSDLELVDPRLKVSEYDLFEMHCMMHAARQCIKKDPGMRPRMTQVLRILDPAQDSDTPYGLGTGGRKVTPDVLPARTTTPEIQQIPDYSRLLSAPHPFSDLQSETIARIPLKIPSRGRVKKPGKTMFKVGRSSSAPRLSYDEEKNLEEEDDGFKKDGLLLSYNSMLEFV